MLTRSLFSSALRAAILDRFTRSNIVRIVGERTPRPDEGRISTATEAQVFVERTVGERTKLDPRLDIANKSPSGFSWGYGGSGPSQLAIAILAEATGMDYFASCFHQEFKSKFIAPADVDRIEISRATIDEFVTAHLDLFLSGVLDQLFDGENPSQSPLLPYSPVVKNLMIDWVEDGAALKVYDFSTGEDPAPRVERNVVDFILDKVLFARPEAAALAARH